MKVETLEARAVSLIRQAAALPIVEVRLMGLDEIAALTKRPKTTVASWHHRGQLPEPVARLRVGPVWAAAIVEEWWAEREQNGSRPR